jgi:hypothetical protein
VLYNCPVQCGPANLLYPTPTGYPATMVGFPYDDLKTWRGPYAEEAFAEQFTRLATGWKDGLAELAEAVSKAPPERQRDARTDLVLAEAAGLHFRSVANQARFTMLRNALAAAGTPMTAERRAAAAELMRTTVLDEIDAARRLFTLSRGDSRIGYEASNHYNYVPADLVEKVINCRYILENRAGF